MINIYSIRNYLSLNLKYIVYIYSQAFEDHLAFIVILLFSGNNESFNFALTCASANNKIVSWSLQETLQEIKVMSCVVI